MVTSVSNPAVDGVRPPEYFRCWDCNYIWYKSDAEKEYNIAIDILNQSIKEIILRSLKENWKMNQLEIVLEIKKVQYLEQIEKNGRK
jgi:hypothetical protein